MRELYVIIEVMELLLQDAYRLWFHGSDDMLIGYEVDLHEPPAVIYISLIPLRNKQRSA
jgi:hypothetical protein